MRTLVLTLAIFSLSATSHGQNNDPNRKREWYDKGIEQYEKGVITPNGQTIFTRVIQIIDENNALLDLHVNFGMHLARRNVETIWAEIPTAGKVDGDVVTFPLEHVGTKQYNTADGATKTVHQWRMVTEERMAELKAKADAQAEADQKANEAKAAEAKAKQKAIDAALTRTWKDSGKPVVGRFVGVKEDIVELQTKERTIRIPLFRLSKEDRDWVRRNANKKGRPK